MTERRNEEKRRAILVEVASLEPPCDADPRPVIEDSNWHYVRSLSKTQNWFIYYRSKQRLLRILELYVGILECVVFLPLQRLAGGVWTLQAVMRAEARVWLMLSPRSESPPLRTWHKHSGFLSTTVLSCVQQPENCGEELSVM